MHCGTHKHDADDFRHGGGCGSLHNVLTHFEGVPGASTEARAVRACVQTCTVCVNVCECMCACVCVS